MRRRRPPKPVDDQIWRATRLFIDGRMTDPAILAWAAELDPKAGAERRAVRDAVFTQSEALVEPYITAWRCVIQGWRDGTAEEPDMSVLEIKEAIGRGADPRLFLEAIVGLAAPRLRVRARNPLSPPVRSAPRTVAHLLAVDLEPDHHVRLSEIGLADCTDARVWQELLDRAEGELFAALHLTERLGLSWSANWVARVYPKDGEGDSDPDEFRSTLVPILRLVSAALSRLAAVDPDAARTRLAGLATRPWPLARRLWAAAAMDPRLAGAGEIALWLADLSDEELWNTHQYPELAELRSARYGDLADGERHVFETRVRRGPPMRLFRRGLTKARRAQRKRGDAFAELRRLERGPGDLTRASLDWLAVNQDLDPVWGADDLYETGSVSFPTSERNRLDLTTSEAFADLENGLTDQPYVEGRRFLDSVALHWDEIVARLQESPALLGHGRLIGALASTLRDSLSVDEGADPEPLARQRVSAFVDLLGRVPVSARNAAATGLSYWFEYGLERLPGDPRLAQLWLEYWPHAAAATNVREEPEADWPFGEEPAAEKLAGQAANSPVGRMMYSYFRMFPTGEAALQAFDDPVLSRGRELIMATEGAAYRQALYRMLLQVRFLNRIDPDWTQAHLLGPLGRHDGVEPEVWDAISRIGLLPSEELVQIAEEMSRRVSDTRLAPDVRARLAERLILPVAYALLDGQAPPISLAALEQLLRMGGREVRAACARALTRFVADGKPPEYAFRTAVLPILEGAWPKDRSAQSEDVADAFAPMPAAAGGALAEAVPALADLLMPFEVWSLWEYRLYRREDGTRELKHPANQPEARAVLELLDRTIGDEEGVVVPHDLDVALQAIVEHWPKAIKDRRFGRLSALARR